MKLIKEVRYSTKAKKDLKRHRHNSAMMKGLYDVLDVLVHGKSLGIEYRPHKLAGGYRGCMECHIESDFLLIWIDRDFIEVVRVGSHSELFE